MTSASEEELAVRAQEGCLASFSELVRRTQVPLICFLQQRAVSRHDAEDLAQEAYLCAYRFLARYSTAWRFRTWLFTIAYRLSLDIRQRVQLHCGDEVETVEARGLEPDVAAAQREGRARLWELAAAALSPVQHAALWLYYVESLSLLEIGQILNRSQMSIKSILFRAGARLLPAVKAEVRLKGRSQPAAIPTGDWSENPVEFADVYTYFTAR